MKGMTIIFVVMIISLGIAFAWEQLLFIKDSVHFALDPTLGQILDWSKMWGLVIVTASLSLVMTVIQKYGTDQETLKEIKKEQKEIQKEIKKYKDNPEKILELNKKQFAVMPDMMKITMRPLLYTMLPFILLFRWFNDYFSVVDFKFLGFLSWFWIYFIGSIIFSQVFRKILKVA